MGVSQSSNLSYEASPLIQEEVSDAEGSQALTTYPGGVIVIRIRGVARAGKNTELLTAKLSQSVASSPRDVHVFFDLEGFTRYDSEVRIRYTDALTKHGSRVKSIHIVADSRLVRMGASVAALVLRQLRIVERASFDRVLEERLSG